MALDQSGNLGKVIAGYDSTTQTCKVASGVNYLITYATMGFSANPQNYILKVQQTVQTVDWKFNRTKQTELQTFPVEVSF